MRGVWITVSVVAILQVVALCRVPSGEFARDPATGVRYATRHLERNSGPYIRLPEDGRIAWVEFEEATDWEAYAATNVVMLFIGVCAVGLAWAARGISHSGMEPVSEPPPLKL